MSDLVTLATAGHGAGLTLSGSRGGSNVLSRQGRVQARSLFEEAHLQQVADELRFEYRRRRLLNIKKLYSTATVLADGDQGLAQLLYQELMAYAMG